MTADLEVQTLASILQHILSEKERRCTFAAVIWERLRDGQKWKECFKSLEELRSNFDGGDELEKMVKKAAERERLLTRADTAMRTYWGCSLSTLFPSDLEPAGSRYSKHFIEQVVTLAILTSKERG